MGLLIEDAREIQRLIEEISRICEIHILDYEVTGRLLDGAVFYITFANTMRQILGLSREKPTPCLSANRLTCRIWMSRANPRCKPLITSGASPALWPVDHRGERFRARVSAEPLAASLTLTTIEPPCGSNAYVLEYGDELLFIDSGFACYADEMRALLSALFPGFARRRKRAFLTHADVDHAGLLNQFDEVCMSRNCYANFAAEREAQFPARRIRCTPPIAR